jgi:hypothetical protein
MRIAVKPRVVQLSRVVVTSRKTFVAEFDRIKECETCDCFELDPTVEGVNAFFHRTDAMPRVYLKHSVLRAQRVRITVEVLLEDQPKRSKPLARVAAMADLLKARDDIDRALAHLRS